MDWDLCKTFVAVAETRSFSSRSAAVALQSSDGRAQDRGTGRPTRHSLVCAIHRRSFADLTGAQIPRTRRCHGTAALRAEAAVSATGAQARGVVKLSIGATFASHWLMPRLGPFLRAHDHIQLEIITHPYPASVRRREADVVLRPVGQR